MSTVTYTRQQADTAQAALDQLLDIIHHSGLSVEDVLAYREAAEAVVLAREHEPATKDEELELTCDVIDAFIDQRRSSAPDEDAYAYDRACMEAWASLLVDPACETSTATVGG